MAVTTKMFSVFAGKYGSGWRGINVVLDQWKLVDAGQKNKKMVVLTDWAVGPEEFGRYIDELIAQLEALKAVGRKELKKIKAEEAIEIEKLRAR